MLQGSEQPKQSAAWAILGLHPSIHSHLGVVSRLMCTSKSMQRMVKACSGGQLTLETGRLPQQQLQAWTAKHGRLIKHLDVARASGAPLAAGLQVAAASSGLLLRSCCASVPDLLAPVPAGGQPQQLCLLQLLPARHVTRLELTLDLTFPDSSSSAAEQTLADGLQQLTALQALRICADRHFLLHELLHETLPVLQQLSSLHVAAADAGGGVQHANAASLLDLQLSCTSDMQPQPRLQLSHLSALTRLQRFSSSNERGEFPAPRLPPGDVLPPRLVELDLDCRDCPGWGQQLLPLHSLRGLTVRVSCSHGTEAAGIASQLLQLTGLPALSRLQLGLRSQPSVACDQVAAVLGNLPLQSLSLTDVPWTQGFLQHLGRLTQLTHISSCGSPLAGWSGHSQAAVEAAMRALAGTVQQLTGLRELELYCLIVQVDLAAEEAQSPQDEWFPGASGNAGIAAATAEYLNVAAVGLPALQSFAADYPLTGNSVLQLAAATRLQDLTLVAAGLTDATLIPVVSALTRLTALDCSFNERVTDASLAVIGARLPLMQVLGLQAVPVTNAGLAHLSQLRQLRRVRCSDTAMDGSEAGLRWTHQLSGLTELAVTSPRVLRRGAAQRLQLRLPRLVLSYDEDADAPFRSSSDDDDDDDVGGGAENDSGANGPRLPHAANAAC